MPQPLVLAIEPDLRQAAIVKRIVKEKVLADVAVVDSRDAALEAMRTTIPDVLLLSALMSPRDEDELIAHLRTLEHAGHVQTHTIPQLASVLGPPEARGPRGLLAAFRRRKEPEVAPSGCDPDLFAEEIRMFLQRAADKKHEQSNTGPDRAPADRAWRSAPPKTDGPVAGAEPVVEAEDPSGSSWSSPFEWKPTSPSSQIAYPESAIANLESLTAESLMSHLRPPSGITTVGDLAVSAQAEEPVPTVARTDPPAAASELDPMLAGAAPIQDAPIQDAPILAAPIPAAPIPDAPIQSAPIPVAPISVAPVPVAKIPDARIPDSGPGLRDQRLGIRDKRLGALASWARAEHQERDVAAGTDDLRELLRGFAVPSGVVAVGYGRGCRIRRVRVPAAREPQESEVAGAVILSKRLLAEERARPVA